MMTNYPKPHPQILGHYVELVPAITPFFESRDHV